MIIIIVLKLNLGVELEPGLSCGWRPLTRVNVRIILIIIKVLKTRVEGRRGARLGSRVGLTIDPCQYKDKNYYYYSFKILFGGRPGARLGPWVELTIDLGQHKKKMIIIKIFKI
jgi:hypothetical protein